MVVISFTVESWAPRSLSPSVFPWFIRELQAFHCLHILRICVTLPGPFSWISCSQTGWNNQKYCINKNKYNNITIILIMLIINNNKYTYIALMTCQDLTLFPTLLFSCYIVACQTGGLCRVFILVLIHTIYQSNFK